MSGFVAVMDIARTKRPSWLHIIRDCHDLVALQERQGGVEHFDVKWLRMRTGRRYPALTPLERWGVLVKKVWRDPDGHVLPESGRSFYLMPDRPGVGLALDELQIPPAKFL